MNRNFRSRPEVLALCNAVFSRTMTEAFGDVLMMEVGALMVGICLSLFAFTTAMSWCVYGERCAIYFFGDKAQWPFRIVYCIAIPLGILTQLDLVWLIADTCNALMAIPNLVAILLLSPVIFKIVKENEASFRAECDKD